jgi:hypothetical protein
MANNLAPNPMYIDTPGTSVLCATDQKLKHIEFVGFSGDTDSCVVEDRFGNVICELTGASAGGDGAVRTGTIGWVYGIKVTTLTSGACLIFRE